jgi:hypothetical protein
MKYYFGLIVLFLLQGVFIISAQNPARFNIILNPTPFLKKGDMVILRVNYLKINDTFASFTIKQNDNLCVWLSKMIMRNLVRSALLFSQ